METNTDYQHVPGLQYLVATQDYVRKKSARHPHVHILKNQLAHQLNEAVLDPHSYVTTLETKEVLQIFVDRPRFDRSLKHDTYVATVVINKREAIKNANKKGYVGAVELEGEVFVRIEKK
jgi:hypothetical protein